MAARPSLSGPSSGLCGAYEALDRQRWRAPRWWAPASKVPVPVATGQARLADLQPRRQSLEALRSTAPLPPSLTSFSLALLLSHLILCLVPAGRRLVSSPHLLEPAVQPRTPPIAAYSTSTAHWPPLLTTIQKLGNSKLRCRLLRLGLDPALGLSPSANLAQLPSPSRLVSSSLRPFSTIAVLAAESVHGTVQ
ncbi:hypothetical protein CCMA1212_008595 [Trichoderma ghanense]|uniref:Uncharacterized protein n=1 Tax=Trichoderma ghanense TaxID=65468 RepID=A0ABY2GVW5_9HYPO